MTTSNPITDGALEQARREFTQISESLLSSYGALTRRAEHVEKELSRTNAELASKVEELDATKRDLEAILEALPTGVVVRDENGSIVRVNPAAARILGTSQDELMGRTEHELLAADDACEREVRRADGARLVISSRYSEVEPSKGARRKSVEILDDRTEVAELSERLHRMDKITALATMAGGIAHEIRNPLNGVQGFANLLRRELEEGSKQHHWASLILDGANEANAIVSSVLCLARPEQLMLETLDPGQLLEDAVESAVPSDAPERWTVTTDNQASPYCGDRIKLRQALRNLIANAIDVQRDGGEVHVEQRVVEDEVVIRVSDAGPGIPADIRGKVTDPFFTTRAEGTGLGLALVSTIAQAHGGRLEISPEPSRLGGAELTIRFPLSGQQLSRTKPSTPTQPQP